MVSARRRFTGSAPMASFARLAGLLADVEGECRYQIEFDRDRSGFAVVDVEAEAGLPLLCQRTLERFVLRVRVHQKLALLAEGADERGLPAEVEPTLVGADGEIHLLDLVEDELLLAVPDFPVRPDPNEAEVVGVDAKALQEQVASPRIHPFAALAALKDRNTPGD